MKGEIRTGQSYIFRFKLSQGRFSCNERGKVKSEVSLRTGHRLGSGHVRGVDYVISGVWIRSCER